MYDFNKIIDRRGSASVKYDDLCSVFGTTDLLPMWVADMDFQAPPVVLEAVRKCCERGVFGYTFRTDSAKQAFRDWVKKRYDWDTQMSWLSSSPGIVTALSLSVRAFTLPGEKILIMTPVYPPFYSVIKENGREVVCSPLKRGKNQYEVDWENFEIGLKNGVRMLILSNSHNPVGRVWTREELERMGKLCCHYGVIIVSDEIHSDLALFGNRHTVMANVSKEIAECTLTAMAPSKTFNIAGMMNSVIVSSNPSLLEKYNRELQSLHLDNGNIFGHITLEAAYRFGEEWLDELTHYLEENVIFAMEYLQRELPEVQCMKPEGSFLLWLDFRNTGLSHEECGKRLVEQGKIGLNDGITFGEEGRGYRRMNIGCPRSVLEEGLKRIKASF
ncbi:MAG: PatB family C-S lyase [Odoribacter sp.]